MKSGLTKISPRRTDYSLIHTYGGTTDGLPNCFSIYDGRPIPNQNDLDSRFTPAVRPLPMGCTAESTTFIAGLEDGALYPPDDFYFNTPPGTDGVGRDIRDALKVAKTRGFKLPDGTLGARKGDYYNCYGSGKIDDFDAVRIALWINQQEKRAPTIGSWWYWGGTSNNTLVKNGILQTPSFNTSEAGLHNHISTGWHTITSSSCACGKIVSSSAPNGTVFLEDIPWCGMNYGDNGLVYISRELYNKLMAQPWTAAFTLAKTPTTGAIQIGWQAIADHLVYYIRNLFHV